MRLQTIPYPAEEILCLELCLEVNLKKFCRVRKGYLVTQLYTYPPTLLISETT